MSEETENAASFGKIHEAEIEETITCRSTTLDIFCVLEDSKCEMNPEPHDDASSIENKASEYLSDLIIQMMGDLRYFVSHPQHGNNQFENVSGIMTMDLPFPSLNEELQEALIAASKHSRRSWEGVKRQLRNLFQGLCCCLLAPSTEVSTSRVQDEAQVHGA